jgi:hypothetical protein
MLLDRFDVKLGYAARLRFVRFCSQPLDPSTLLLQPQEAQELAPA